MNIESVYLKYAPLLYNQLVAVLFICLFTKPQQHVISHGPFIRSSNRYSKGHTSRFSLESINAIFNKTLGVFLVMTTNTILPIDRVNSINTYRQRFTLSRKVSVV